jgi:glycogen synthase
VVRRRRRASKAFKWTYLAVVLGFLYLPIAVMIALSFNSSISRAEWTGFTFDWYQADLLLDAIRRAKALYFEDRGRWNDMVKRDMAKDVSWENSARKYMALYDELSSEEAAK